MNNKYTYLAVALVIIVAGIILIGGKDTDKTQDTNTATTTDSTKNTNKAPAQSGTNTTKPTSVKTPVNPTSPQTPVTNTPDSIATPKDIVGEVFRLTNYNGTAIPLSSKYTLSFDGESLSAKFCNSMQGVYVLDKDKNHISVRNLSSTMMYCSEPAYVMEMESAFGSILGFGATMSQYGNSLMLTNSKGTTFIFTGFTN